jgi:hypothetical protein
MKKWIEKLKNPDMAGVGMRQFHSERWQRAIFSLPLLSWPR